MLILDVKEKGNYNSEETKLISFGFGFGVQSSELQLIFQRSFNPPYTILKGNNMTHFISMNDVLLRFVLNKTQKCL